MKIRFLEVAETELDDAVNFYNRELPGLGDRFLAEILDVLDRVAQFPSAWHPARNERDDAGQSAFRMG